MRAHALLTLGFAACLATGCRNEERFAQPGAVASESKHGNPVPVDTTHVNRNGRLAGMQVAILATDGFEQAELIEPRQALANEGATSTVISPKGGTIQGYEHG